MRRIKVRESRPDNPFVWHQLNIARKTMRLSCIGARIMGGMNHRTAAELLNLPVPKDCDCPDEAR